MLYETMYMWCLDIIGYRINWHITFNAPVNCYRYPLVRQKSGDFLISNIYLCAALQGQFYRWILVVCPCRGSDNLCSSLFPAFCHECQCNHMVLQEKQVKYKKGVLFVLGTPDNGSSGKHWLDSCALKRHFCDIVIEFSFWIRILNFHFE